MATSSATSESPTTPGEQAEADRVHVGWPAQIT
jgi:hypothetical protein